MADASVIRFECEVNGEREEGNRHDCSKRPGDAKIGREVGPGMDDYNQDSVGYWRT